MRPQKSGGGYDHDTPVPILYGQDFLCIRAVFCIEYRIEYTNANLLKTEEGKRE